MSVMIQTGFDEDRGAWRKRKRSELLATRSALAKEIFELHSNLVLEQLTDILNSRRGGTLGFYWPFRGEISLLTLIERYIVKGWVVALPVVVERGRPLEFRRWNPGDRMALGVFDIPYPSEGAVVQPDVLIVPVVGYDDQCFRLGYGGGYYDRTLVSYTPKPFAIGIGFECARLETIYPHQFDIPMDCIVTEAKIHWRSRPTDVS